MHTAPSGSSFTPSADPLLSGRPGILWWGLLGLIFAVGLAVRLFDLAGPPLDFHPTRQLHSALIARGMYLESRVGAPAWQRELAITQWHSEGLIEPQVFERLAAWTYALAGGPDLRFPRLYAIALWLVAAVFVTLLAREMVGRAGALVAAVFFLAWPYGVVASRAFQPEPLMVALLAAALWAALRWERRGTWAWTVATGLLTGLAIYIKPVAVFFLLPALAVLALARCGPRKAIRDPRVWSLALLAALPTAVYFIDGLLLRGYLIGQLSQRFFPAMWLDPAFYLRWLSNLGRAIPFEMVLVALLGALLIHRPAYRVMLLAMWVGYAAYGLALPHHISTHDYYHLPLFPQVALGLASASQALFTSIRGPRWLARAAVSAVVVAALVMNAYDARAAIKRSGAQAQASALQAVGKALGPGSSVIALVDDYGSGLKYYAWINPAIWPTAADIRFEQESGQSFDFDSFFSTQAAQKDYFVVIQMDELANQPRLKDLLSSRYPVLAQSPGYIIYDLRKAKAGFGTP